MIEIGPIRAPFGQFLILRTFLLGFAASLEVFADHFDCKLVTLQAGEPLPYHDALLGLQQDHMRPAPDAKLRFIGSLLLRAKDAVRG